ncbi:hypothetical protein AB4Y88_00475 [Paenarthrobacter sp. RAF9]
MALPASATTSAIESPPPAAGEGIYVLGAPTDSTEKGAEFYAVPDEYRDSLLITPEVAADLQLPPGPVAETDVAEVSAKVAAVETASRTETSKKADGGFSTLGINDTSFSYGPGTAWLGPYQRNTSLSGCCSHFYSWYVDGALSTQACLQGQGYYTGYNGGSFGLWAAWYSLGCGASGGYTVPWDNVSAYPKVLARSQYGYYGGGIFN